MTGTKIDFYGYVAVLRIRDPVLFDPGSGMGKNQEPDPGLTSRITFPRA
jgi:hypothetical protein